MVTKLVETIEDDITGQAGALHRGIGIWNGKGLDWYDIDLMPGSYKQLFEQFNRALAKFLAAGRLRRITVSDMGALFAALESTDQPPAELKRTELPPEGPTAKAIRKGARKAARGPWPTSLYGTESVKTRSGKVAKKPGNTLAVRAERAKALPPMDQRPIDPNTGKPFTDHMMRTSKRPGIFDWHGKHWKLLGLPEPAELNTGRLPKVVEEAYDRYRGLPVTEDMILPEDLERITAPKG